ncbi:hypothetical protein NC652_028880 [Populus alba x Populus x berolinensis]|nr:hypothetical protein NC652_028880 [Populus alba x Populus x berolinensis]
MELSRLQGKLLAEGLHNICQGGRNGLGDSAGEESPKNSLTSLRELVIHKIPEVVSFTERAGLPYTLQHLQIIG